MIVRKFPEYQGRVMTEDQANKILENARQLNQKLRQEKLYQGLPSHDLGIDIELTPWIVEKVKTRRDYAQNLYAAFCNREWQEQSVFEVLRGETWSCSWRSAGGLVARLRGVGDYLDWYCSGMCDKDNESRWTLAGFVPEGVVTLEIEHDLAQIGWRVLADDQSLE